MDQALEEYGNSEDEWGWRLRILKARILVSRSQYEDALKLLHGEVPSSLASADLAEQRRLYQGIAHRGVQQFQEAAQDFDDAEKMIEVLPARYRCQLYLARAALQVDIKKYREAEATYKSALAIARNDKSPLLEVNALTALGRLAANREHFDEAVEIDQAALRMSDSLGTRGNKATILGNLGWTYFELGDFENALKNYQEGGEASASTGLPVYSAYWFTGVANSYVALRDYAHAERLALDTLKNAQNLNNAQTETQCLNTLTEVMFKTERLSEAKQYSQEALGIEESGKDKFGVPDSLIWAGHIASAEKRFSDAEQFFNRALSEFGADDAPLRWQAESGLAGARDGEGKTRKAEQLYQQAISTIETARNSIGHEELRLSFLSSGIAVYGKYIDFLIAHGKPGDALKQAELSRSRTLAEGLSSGEKTSSRSTPVLAPQQLAQQMRATLLFYWLGERHSYLWAVTASKTQNYTLPPMREIETLIGAYQQAIIGSQDVFATDAKKTGEKLFATLIEPAERLISGSRRIILLPDAGLYGLNFETLIAPGTKPHYWIEDVTLTVANSLTMVANAAGNRSGTKGGRLLLIGNTKEANPEFPPLVQSPVEMREVERYFPEPQRTVFEGERATPVAYLNGKPEGFAYIHFSTHGTASRTRPLDSAVILSREGESYKLYARDIVGRHLRAELVTISACYGSGRRTYSGEGLVGLSWAFLHAGAHKVIGALWEVADASSTPDLMDELYKGLNQGKEPATALRDAKLKLLRSGNVFAKPFYWAPFQLYAGS